MRLFPCLLATRRRRILAPLLPRGAASGVLRALAPAAVCLTPSICWRLSAALALEASGILTPALVGQPGAFKFGLCLVVGASAPIFIDLQKCLLRINCPVPFVDLVLQLLPECVIVIPSGSTFILIAMRHTSRNSLRIAPTLTVSSPVSP